MNKINSKITLGVTVFSTALAINYVINTLPAQALTWTLNSGSLNGTFVIDDESLSPPTLTAANINAGAVTFTLADFVQFNPVIPTGNDIVAIDFVQGINSLALVFDSPLTNVPGVVNLDPASDFNGNPISGSATGSITPQNVSSVPFEFSTIPGLLALGLICGGNYAWKKYNNKNDNNKNNGQIIK